MTHVSRFIDHRGIATVRARFRLAALKLLILLLIALAAPALSAAADHAATMAGHVRTSLVTTVDEACARRGDHGVESVTQRACALLASISRAWHIQRRGSDTPIQRLR